MVTVSFPRTHGDDDAHCTMRNVQGISQRLSSQERVVSQHQVGLEVLQHPRKPHVRAPANLGTAVAGTSHRGQGLTTTAKQQSSMTPLMAHLELLHKLCVSQHVASVGGKAACT